MCGLAGHSGIRDNKKRAALTRALAYQIDNRGGHAAGFLSVSSRAVRYLRTTGPWKSAGETFIQGAAAGSITAMLHSRYATCGKRVVAEAHPFAIKRKDTNGILRTILWGAHNGTINNHEESAKENGRKPSVVDSQEIFELIADQDYDGVRDLQGYGAITWIDAFEPGRVKLCRISSSGDLEAAKLKGESGVVWASTTYILKEAIRAAGLEIDVQYDLKAGQVYDVVNGEIFYSTDEALKDLKVKPLWEYYYNGNTKSGSSASSGSSSHISDTRDRHFGTHGGKTYRWNHQTNQLEEYDRYTGKATNATGSVTRHGSSEAALALAGGWGYEDIDDGWTKGDTLDSVMGESGGSDESIDACMLQGELAELESDDLQEIILDDQSPELWRTLARLEAQERRERRIWQKKKDDEKAKDAKAIDRIIDKNSNGSGNLPKAVGSE